MKKLTVLLLALILLLGLSACTGNKPNDPTTVPTTTPTTAPATIPTTAPTTAPTTEPITMPTVEPNVPDPDVDGNSQMPGDSTARSIR